MPPPLLVMPEGTTTTVTNTVTSPFSSAASLLPISPKHSSPPSHRLPKAKCFILPSIPPTTTDPTAHSHSPTTAALMSGVGDVLHGSFVSDGMERGNATTRVPNIVRMIDGVSGDDEDSSESSFLSADDGGAVKRLQGKVGGRVYDYDDDFPSIGASESTHPRSRGVRGGEEGFKDREGSGIVGSWEEVEFGRGVSVSFGNGSRVSFASSLRRRVSWCQTREEKMRTRMRKGGVEDSVVRDFREARLRTSGVRQHAASTESKGRGRGGGDGKGGGRAGWGGGKWGLTAWFAKVWKKRDEEEEEEGGREDVYEGAGTGGRDGGERDAVPGGVVVDERKMDDVQFISMLAYDEFMHSPNRPSPMAKMFSRLRRG